MQLRFGPAFNLNLHFYKLVLDGVYIYRDNRSPRFQRVKAPDKGELESLVQLKERSLLPRVKFVGCKAPKTTVTLAFMFKFLQRNRQPTPRIFNIAFNKSGTTSLTRAMELLGYRSAHHREKSVRIAEIIKSNQSRGEAPLHGLDHTFFSDFNGHFFYRDLDLAYPNSKFILTVRDMEDWLASREACMSSKVLGPQGLFS